MRARGTFSAGWGQAAALLMAIVIVSVAAGSSAAVAADPKKQLEHGWVALVYDAKRKARPFDETAVIGQFILTDMPFNLTAHRNHSGFGFSNRTPSYKLEGLLEVPTPGRYSFAIKLDFPVMQAFLAKSRGRQWPGVKKAYIDCLIMLDVDGQSLLRTRAGTAANYRLNKQRRYLHTTPEQSYCGASKDGVVSADLQAGFHQVALTLSCEGARELQKKVLPTTDLGFHESCPQHQRGDPIRLDRDPRDEVVLSLLMRRPGDPAPKLVTAQDVYHEVSP